eukprot:gene27793-33568_t
MSLEFKISHSLTDEALAAPSPVNRPKLNALGAISSLCFYTEGHATKIQLIFASELLIALCVSLFSLVVTIHSVAINHFWPELHAPIVPPNIALVAYALASSSLFLLHTTSSECINGDMSFRAVWLCKRDGDFSSFPILVSLSSPVVVSALLHQSSSHPSSTINMYTLSLSWLITLATLFICLGLTVSSSTITTAVAYVFLTLTVYSSQLAKTSFPDVSKVPRSKSDAGCSVYERDSVGSDFSKDMMRHMIANVAHDLKTPLASFMTGIDIITEVLVDCRQHMQDGALTADFMDGALGTLQQCDTLAVETAPGPQEQSLRKVSTLAMLTSSTSSSHINFRRVSPLMLASASTEEFAVQPGRFVLKVEVEDVGIGMSEQAMLELFSPFKQTQRLAGGTGLGLFSLAKRVEALRGQCGVCRRRDGQRGSLFWFTIPYRPDEDEMFKRTDAGRSLSRVQSMDSIGDVSNLQSINADSILYPGASSPIRPDTNLSNQQISTTDPLGVDAASTAILPTLSATHNAPTPFHILLVDDSPAVLKMMTMMLMRQGHLVTAAENGAVALDALTASGQFASLPGDLRVASAPSSRFDIVLMDLQMPVMDGIEAVKRLRQFEAEQPDLLPRCSLSGQEPVPVKCRLLVIGLSANCEDDVVQETASAGFDAFLSKPFSLNSFMELVNELQL